MVQKGFESSQKVNGYFLADRLFFLKIFEDLKINHCSSREERKGSVA
jgi:hypothetical protein